MRLLGFSGARNLLSFSIKHGLHLTDAPLLTLRQMRELNLYKLQARIRPMTSPVYLGGNHCLCRVLGRYKFYVLANDIGFGAHVLLDGTWELWITQFLARLIKPGQTVVDVGANHGYFTLLMADAVGPKGVVYAIEPNPRLREVLTQSLAVNGFSARTRLWDVAATDQDNVELLLTIPNNEPKNGHLTPHASDPNAIPIKGMSLATLLADAPRIDLLKIDVEGAEEAVLNGGWDVIQRDRPDIILEFNRHRCRDPQGLLTRLRSLYGSIHHLNTPEERIEVDDATLLNPDRIEDWMIHLTLTPH